MLDAPSSPGDIHRLLAIMAKLRDPEQGCPWDRKQSFATILPYTLEEAYEVADAIERQAMDELRDELGDLLFQIVFYAQLAKEQGEFDFADVVAGICDKMIRRHPHVFAGANWQGETELRLAWEQEKARERAGRSHQGLLDGIARSLPALVRADKLQRRAARVGFDWEDIGGVFAKVREEIGEIEQELAGEARSPRLEQEVGDLLFACVNLARHLQVDAEPALRSANGRFERRFRHIETGLAARGKNLAAAALAEMDALWEEAKRQEHPG